MYLIYFRTFIPSNEATYVPYFERRYLIIIPYYFVPSTTYHTKDII